MSEIENKISSITDLATNTTPNTKFAEIENNMPNISDFIKSTNIDKKVSTVVTYLGTEDKITTILDYMVENRK